MKEITLPIDDRLLLFGYGLFETLLVTARGIPLLREHWQRMSEGAATLELALPGFAEWTDGIRKFLRNQTGGGSPYALRLTLTGGAPSSDHPSALIMQVRPFPYHAAQYEAGIVLHLLSTPRNEHSPLVGIKSTNYLENILARQEALRHAAEEGIWFNFQGQLAEGAMSNIFFVKNDMLFTPALSCGCLPGTRRAFVLKLARKLRIKVSEGAFLKENLLQADEVFLTNALMGIMPVRRIGEQSLMVAPPASAFSVTRLLAKKLDDFLPYTDISWSITRRGGKNIVHARFK